MSPAYELSPMGNFMAGMRDEARAIRRTGPCSYLLHELYWLDVQSSQNRGEIQNLRPVPLGDQTHYCACCDDERARKRFFNCACCVDDCVHEKFYICGAGCASGLSSTLCCCPIAGIGGGILYGTSAAIAQDIGMLLTFAGLSGSTSGWIRCCCGLCRSCSSNPD